MEITITPEQLFLVEKYLDESARTREAKLMSVDDKQALFKTITDSLKSLLKFGSKLDYGKYGEAFEITDVGILRLRDMMDNKPEIFREVLSLYRTVSQEEIYLNLLGKEVGKMTGYEFQILSSFILRI